MVTMSRAGCQVGSMKQITDWNQKPVPLIHQLLSFRQRDEDAEPGPDNRRLRTALPLHRQGTGPSEQPEHVRLRCQTI